MLGSFGVFGKGEHSYEFYGVWQSIMSEIAVRCFFRCSFYSGEILILLFFSRQTIDPTMCIIIVSVYMSKTDIANASVRAKHETSSSNPFPEHIRNRLDNGNNTLSIMRFDRPSLSATTFSLSDEEVISTSRINGNTREYQKKEQLDPSN
jgi:hypothetical protein